MVPASVKLFWGWDRKLDWKQDWLAKSLHSLLYFSGLPLFYETRPRPDLSLMFPFSTSEQSEEEGEKKKKTKKKASEGHREDSSSEEGSDSSSSSESEVTSESESEQVEPSSWRKKTVRASSYPMVGHLPSIQNRLYVSHHRRESQGAPLPTPITREMNPLSPSLQSLLPPLVLQDMQRSSPGPPLILTCPQSHPGTVGCTNGLQRSRVGDIRSPRLSPLSCPGVPCVACADLQSPWLLSLCCAPQLYAQADAHPAH